MMPTLSVIDPSFAQTAPQKVVVERHIPATPAELWRVLADNSTWMSWFPGMSFCTTTSQTPTGIGSTRTVKVGPLVADEYFILWEPESAWGFCVTRTNLPVAKRMLEQVQLFANQSNGTLVRYTGAFDPHPLTRLAFGLTKRQVRAAWTGGLAGLEKYVTQRK
jgi:Polyketide cyclase / dehydrase and lipid transport